MNQTLKVATWNVNSIRIRLTHLYDWIRVANPDVICLQETKVQDHDFPTEPFEELGYNLVVAGQKSYNGVAIFSLDEPEDVQIGFPEDDSDPQKRFIAATVGGVRVICVYVPNGGETPADPKFTYKMEFLTRLEAHLTSAHTPETPLILCGDYNIAPGDLDLFNPDNYRETVMFHSREHAFLNRWKEWGLTDVVRQQHPEERDNLFTWWNYRTNAFPQNRGWRIDHLWATRPLAEKCTGAVIFRDERGKDQPSDHVPVMATFKS